MKVYHYTDTKGKTAIENSQQILQSKSDSRRDDAMYGNGVYLTSISPENPTSVILGNNWDGIVIPMSKKARTEWYFEFDTDGPHLVDNVEVVGDENNRDIWLLRGKDLPCPQRAGRRRP